MIDQYAYYIEANLVCVVIFGIMLARDLFNVDRQEKQIKYDHALIAFMLYFISDALWAAVIDGIFPKTRLNVVLTNFSNYIIMAAITYMWLRFVMAVEQVPHRERRINKIAVLFPFVVSTIALIVTYLVAPQVLLNEALEPQHAYDAFQVTVPYIYIAAVIIYVLKRARGEESASEKRRHLYIGFFPLMVVAGGLLQMLVSPSMPIFCFSCTILMLIFYIQSMETQISVDPLTKLNNRGQLLRYTAQKSNIYREGRLTYVIMIDINDFKLINDTYGHAEGDHALVLVADALRRVSKHNSTSTFIGRYGGDEFIFIIHPSDRNEVEALVSEIREQIASSCQANNAPYVLTLGVGYDALAGGEDTFLRCMQRADKKLYLDKARMKGQSRRVA